MNQSVWLHGAQVRSDFPPLPGTEHADNNVAAELSAQVSECTHHPLPAMSTGPSGPWKREVWSFRPATGQEPEQSCSH